MFILRLNSTSTFLLSQRLYNQEDNHLKNEWMNKDKQPSLAEWLYDLSNYASIIADNFVMHVTFV